MKEKSPSYINIKRLNDYALNVSVGQTFTIDRRKYIVKKIYPYFIVLEDKQGRKRTMTNGELVVFRISGLKTNKEMEELN